VKVAAVVGRAVDEIPSSARAEGVEVTKIFLPGRRLAGAATPPAGDLIS
jgi:hypothetical protein